MAEGTVFPFFFVFAVCLIFRRSKSIRTNVTKNFYGIFFVANLKKNNFCSKKKFYMRLSTEKI